MQPCARCDYEARALIHLYPCTGVIGSALSEHSSCVRLGQIPQSWLL